jgi:hypothetical protein
MPMLHCIHRVTILFSRSWHLATVTFSDTAIKDKILSTSPEALLPTALFDTVGSHAETGNENCVENIKKTRTRNAIPSQDKLHSRQKPPKLPRKRAFHTLRHCTTSRRYCLKERSDIKERSSLSNSTEASLPLFHSLRAEEILISGSWRRDPFDTCSILQNPRASMLLAHCKPSHLFITRRRYSNKILILRFQTKI